MTAEKTEKTFLLASSFARSPFAGSATSPQPSSSPVRESSSPFPFALTGDKEI